MAKSYTVEELRKMGFAFTTNGDIVDKQIDKIIKANIQMAGFILLVRRMREAQKRKEFTDSTLDREAMYECRKLTKQRESEVDEWLEKIK